MPNADSIARPRLDIEQINASLQRELLTIASSSILDFHPAGAFLFVLDPYSQLLEPLFESHSFPYEKLGAVAPTYNPQLADSTWPPQLENAGIASVAFTDGDAFSQDPDLDLRFGAVARRLHTEYGIVGSMMAIRIDDFFGKPYGVVVVHSAKKKQGLCRQDETQYLSRLRDVVSSLRAWFQVRSEVCARMELHCCQYFVNASFRHASIPRSVARACAVFLETCSSLFLADSLHLRVQHEQLPSEWHPNLPKDQADALEMLAEHDISMPVFALNRARQAAVVAAVLDVAFNGHYVWTRIRTAVRGHAVICIARRRATSILEHWQPSDLALLQQAVSIFAEHLARANHFEHLLNHLPAVAGIDDKQARFRLLTQVLRDYFGFDQVLLAKVKRKPDRYKICTEFVDGFGPNQEITKSRHKQFLPGRTNSEPLDIMELIVNDFERGSLRETYELSCDSRHLDQEIVDKCKLRGSMYFVPCCFADDLEKPPVLQSILHVGSADGTVSLEADSIPLMRTIASRIAEWLVLERKRDAATVIDEIRKIDHLNPEALDFLTSRVASVTGSIGCTVFIHVENLSLCQMGRLTSTSITQAMQSFLSTISTWNEILTVPVATKLLDMFAALFGLSRDACKDLLSQPCNDLCANAAAAALYVKAAQSNSNRVSDSLFDIIRDRPRISKDAFARRFGRFLFENCYFPGYGLTGWVLFHALPLSLSDKSLDSIDRFFSALTGFLEPYWSKGLLTVLRAADCTKSSLEKNQWAYPTHADHLSEDPERRAPKAAYIAFPIEGIDALGRPAGVIRVSCSHRVNRDYTRDDENTVCEAARHISVLLRRAHMRDRSYVAAQLSLRGEDNEFYHYMWRLEERFSRLSTLLKASDVLSTSHHNVELRSVIDSLLDVCHSALAKEEHEGLVLEMRDVDSSAWSSPFSIASYLTEWMKAASMPIEVRIGDIPATNAPHADFITLAFRVVHEIARNLRKHRGVRAPAVFIRGGDDVTFFVGDAPSLVLVNEIASWAPYSTVIKSPHGGGTKLILEANDLSKEMSVDVGTLWHEGQERMIGRVQHQRR